MLEEFKPYLSILCVVRNSQTPYLSGIFTSIDSRREETSFLPSTHPASSPFHLSVCVSIMKEGNIVLLVLCTLLLEHELPDKGRHLEYVEEGCLIWDPFGSVNTGSWRGGIE